MTETFDKDTWSFVLLHLNLSNVEHNKICLLYVFDYEYLYQSVFNQLRHINVEICKRNHLKFFILASFIPHIRLPQFLQMIYLIKS